MVQSVISVAAAPTETDPAKNATATADARRHIRS
jgi:hypothetical protein